RTGARPRQSRRRAANADARGDAARPRHGGRGAAGHGGNEIAVLPRRRAAVRPGARGRARDEPTHARVPQGQAMNLTTVRYGVDGGVATLTLDRPEARNALNRAMCDDIVAAAAAA